MTDRPEILTENPWRVLRQFTDARIGLGRVGVSLPTRELLAFQLAHAQARDAVHQPLDTARLVQDLRDVASLHPAVICQSCAVDRDDYLRHPPKGGKLRDADASRLIADKSDLAIVIADGLSARAVQDNTVSFLKAFMAAMPDVRTSVPVIVTQGRVAVGDHVGALLEARAVLVLIGERPGLSSPDSLGLYFTWAPEVGLHDAKRNCISNVRPAGLDFDRAAARAVYLYSHAARLGMSGVALKDRSSDVIKDVSSGSSFLAPPS